MKIISLKLKNIQSIAEETEIKFNQAPFSEESIFLICGPTGSGKSTLLDAINLALFKETPRTGGKISAPGINEQGMVITRGAISALAEVIYEMDSNHRFKSTFSAERTPRSQGFNPNHLKMTLMKWSGGNWELVTEKEKEVIAENTANIGLDASQFRMAVMLAQGDFAKLLKAAASERAYLLEKITGKSLFRKIGRKIFERFSSKKQEITLAEAAMGGIEILSEEERNQLTESLNIKVQEVQQRNQEIQQRKNALQWWLNQTEIDRKTERKIQLQEQKNQIHAQFSTVENDFQKHELAQIHVPQLQQRKSFQEKMLFIQNQIIVLNQQKSENTSQLNQLKSTINGQKNDFLCQENWWEELQEKGQQAKVEKEKITLETVQKKSAQEQVNTLLNRWNWSHETPKTTWQTWKQETEQIFDQQRIQRDEIEQEVENIQQKIQQAERWKENENYLQEKSKALEVQKQDLNSWTQKEKEILLKIEPLNLQHSELNRVCSALELEVDGLQKLADASQIRATLEKGLPCVVCGSTEHPFAHLAFDDTLKIKKKELDEIRDKIQKSSDDLRLLDQQKIEFQEKKATSSALIATFQSQFSEIETSLADLRSSDFNSAEEALFAHRSRWAELQDARNRAEQWKQLERAEPYFLQIENLQQSIKLGSDRYFQHYPERFLEQVDPWLAFANEKLGSLRNGEQQLSGMEADKSRLQQELKNCEEQLISAIQSTPFQNLTELEKALAPEEMVRHWREWKSQIEQLQGLLQELEVEINQRKQQQAAQPIPTQSEQEIKSELQGLEEQQQQALIAQGTLEEKISQDLHNRNQTGAMLEQIQAMKTEFQHWNVLQTAFGDATGDRFSKIAQQYTLDLLIQIANKKLSEFKARYILQQEKHPKGDSHLVVVDQYLGNQIRSVDTLSGGEMFLTSLALAMALSEFASQNAQLNTLFIDEGFGTLDPDSLNAAMEAIDTIRHQSKKMIGLISHVQELRERIHCQIEVKPKGNGQSAIEIRTQST